MNCSLLEAWWNIGRAVHWYVLLLGGVCSSSTAHCPLRSSFGWMLVGNLRLVGEVVLSTWSVKKIYTSFIPLRDIALVMVLRSLPCAFRMMVLWRLLGRGYVRLSPLPGVVVVVKGWCSHWVDVKAHLLRLLNDSLEAVNKTIVILVAFKDVKAREHKFVFFLNKFV